MATGTLYTSNGLHPVGSAVSNLDSCDRLGLYRYNTSTINRPNDYGTCLTLAPDVPTSNGAGWVTQIASGTNNTVCARWRINNGAWSSWAFISNGTGPVQITGGVMTGDLQRKNTTIDASKANNNVSTTQYPTTCSILDSSNRTLARLESIVESGGNISSHWYVCNYNTSGTRVAAKGIKITVNKSGTATYTVDDAANFRSAIGAAASSHNHGAGEITSGTLADARIPSLAASKITSGTFSADRLPTSGVTAGSYGPSANASPTLSNGTFSVPYITVDNKGRVTAASTKTITLPVNQPVVGPGADLIFSTGFQAYAHDTTLEKTNTNLIRHRYIYMAVNFVTLTGDGDKTTTFVMFPFKGWYGGTFMGYGWQLGYGNSWDGAAMTVHCNYKGTHYSRCQMSGIFWEQGTGKLVWKLGTGYKGTSSGTGYMVPFEVWGIYALGA